MSGFPAEFAKHCFVSAYLLANKLAKDGPVALMETYVLTFRVSLCSSRSKLGLQSAFESDHRRLELAAGGHANVINSKLFFCWNPSWNCRKSCLLTTIVYMFFEHPLIDFIIFVLMRFVMFCDSHRLTTGF